MSHYTGQCLCGDTTYKTSGEPSTPHACHCDNCQRFTGNAFVGIGFEGLTVKGPVNWYPSSEWGERGSCAACGSALFWRMQDGSGPKIVTIGSLNNSDNLPAIDLHYFADNADPSFLFKDGVKKMSRTETLAMFASAANS